MTLKTQKIAPQESSTENDFFSFDGKNFKILPSKNPTNKLAILFSGTYKNSGQFDFWKVGHSLQEEVNVILLNNGRNEWYQRGVPDFGDSLEDSISQIQRIAKHLKTTDITVVGVSMGGYGAVLFGLNLECKILAFGIDSLLKIDGSRSAKSMNSKAKMTFPDLRPIIESSKTKIDLIVGEMDPLDLYGAHRISDLKNVNIITVRGMDHGGGRYIEKTRGLKPFILEFINTNKIPFISECGTAILGNTSTLLYKSHCSALENDWDASENFARNAISENPTCEAAHYRLAITLIKLRRFEEARIHLYVVVSLIPWFWLGRYYLAYCMRREKMHDVALHMFLLLQKEKPDSALVEFNLGMTYQSLGEHKLAYESVHRAVILKPENESYSNQLKKMAFK